jgi:predicted acetyltransferase
MAEADKPAMAESRAGMVGRGQCDIERSQSDWDDYFERKANDGFIVVDPKPEGGLRGWILYKHENVGGKDLLRLMDLVYDDAAALRRQLAFLGSLRDQYSAAALILPVDLPLNLLLKETQVPHRGVSHAAAELRIHTRMQVRILDHARMLAAMNLPAHHKGSAVIEVRETEGFVSKFRIELEGGRASAKATNVSPDIVCTDRTWAGIVMGDLPIAKAAEMELVELTKPNAADALEAFAEGPVPFCSDGF